MSDNQQQYEDRKLALGNTKSMAELIRDNSRLSSSLAIKTARIAELEEVLTKLVALKNMKDGEGKTSSYQLRQPLAWEAARNTLNDACGEKK